MKQYSVNDMQRILEKNGFRLFRTRGSHQVWKREEETLVLPCVRLSAVIASRLIKQYHLQI